MSSYRHCTAFGRKYQFWSMFKRTMNILNAVIRSVRSRRRSKEWRPSHRSFYFQRKWRRSVDVYHWIHAIGLAFASRFGELAGRTECLIKFQMTSRLAKPVAVMQWLEVENELINHRQILTQEWEKGTIWEVRPILRLYHSAGLIGRCYATVPSVSERHPAELHLKYQI